MRLSKNQLQAVEKALFEVARKQKSSAGPVELPLPDFWASVGQLTSSLEAELSETVRSCLLYTSPSPRDRQKSRMPSSA